jgi:ElaA protein
MAHALRLLGDDATVTLDAQAQLEGWYARFGFARSGQPFVEDGIPHVPMDRPAHRPAADPA